MNQQIRPAVNELEVCVFSRCGGEAIAVHVGDHRWVLIDSLTLETGEPAAIDYLNAIGVGPSAVDAILLTHWHDDHIKGAAKMVAACLNATVAMPIVLKKGEFYGFIDAIRPAEAVDNDYDTGVTELNKILRLLFKERPGLHKWVLANCRFMLNQQPAYQFEALSPSNEDVNAFLASLPAMLADIPKGGRLPSPDRNDTSVAAVITVGDDQMLFGADLEVSTPLRGWDALHAHAWMNRGKSSFFKIPHHGSKNAHYASVWSDMLVNDVFAALTPWNKNKGLPQKADLSRIANLTSNAFAASTAQSRRAAKKDSVTNGILRDDGVELVKSPTDLGYLRFRKPIGANSTWIVECFGVGGYRIAA